MIESGRTCANCLCWWGDPAGASGECRAGPPRATPAGPECVRTPPGYACAAHRPLPLVQVGVGVRKKGEK